jgi:hypothetical protein
MSGKGKEGGHVSDAHEVAPDEDPEQHIGQEVPDPWVGFDGTQTTEEPRPESLGDIVRGFDRTGWT